MRPNYTIFAKFQKFSQISTFQKKAFFLRLLNIHWLTSVQMSRAEAHLGVSPAAPSQDEPALTLEQVKKKTKKNFGTAEKKTKKNFGRGEKNKKNLEQVKKLKKTLEQVKKKQKKTLEHVKKN